MSDSFHSVFIRVSSEVGSGDDEGIIETNAKDDKWQDLCHACEWGTTNEKESKAGEETEKNSDNSSKSKVSGLKKTDYFNTVTEQQRLRQSGQTEKTAISRGTIPLLIALVIVVVVGLVLFFVTIKETAPVAGLWRRLCRHFRDVVILLQREIWFVKGSTVSFRQILQPLNKKHKASFVKMRFHSVHDSRLSFACVRCH